MTRVIVGAADQNIATQLRGMLSEILEAQVLGYQETASELSAAVAREKPDVVIVHDQLAPHGLDSLVRELTLRAPAVGVLVVNSAGNFEEALSALEAGAKGVLSDPLSFDDLATKFDSARQWAERMGGLISGAVEDTGRELGRHGRITVFAGSKGGVGTTTVATHMAIDLQRKVPGIRVCLVDLDLQAGDVTGILEARQRVSIADVARVSEDLDIATLTDALVRHESGVSLLLAPALAQETEFVTAGAVRAMLGLLRQEFHVILVDGGAHPTPAQAAAVEVADEVVTVVTPDVLSLRSYRRTLQAWEGLGVRTEDDVHVLVNRASKADVVNTEAITKLVAGKLVSVQLPAAFRWLERSVNARNPEELTEAAWWRAIEEIGAEVGVYRSPSGAGPERPAPTKPRRRRGGTRVRSQSGQVAVETVGIVPLVALVSLMVWQVGLTALAFVWQGHAANAAVRAQALGEGPAAVQQAAEDAVPAGLRDDVRARVNGDGSVTVTTAIPILCPGCASLPTRIQQRTEAVAEPGTSP